MTPPATATATSAARTAPGVRRTPVRRPRRISGPASTARAAASALAIPAPGIALPRQRPSRPRVKPRAPAARKPAGRGAQSAPGIALRAVDAFEGISSSAVLDRLIRGRAWIGLLAFALIGIVAMQLFVLQLNTGIGRTLTRVAQLQRENAQLGIEASAYSAESRIAPLATGAGMMLPPAGTVHFVAVSPSNIARAATALSTPVPAASVAESAQAPSGESESAQAEGGEGQTAAATAGTEGSTESSAAIESSAATSGSQE